MNGESRAVRPGPRDLDAAQLTSGLPEWVDIDGLAAWLGESRRTVEWWRYQAQAPRAHKIGNKIKFARADIAAWLAERAEP